jgi:RNA polymerase sigma-70 factor (ECF subfamily)
VQLADAMARELPHATMPDAGADALLIAAEEQERNRDRIGRALHALSDRYRLAIELRLIEELPRDECARRMDVTTGTFDVVLFRAVRAFRRHFGQWTRAAVEAARTADQADGTDGDADGEDR